MAMTLLEAAKLHSGDVLRSGVIETFARNSDILTYLPFSDIAGNAYKYSQEETLPGVGFRGLNEAFSEDVGVINPQVEALAIAGGDLDVDRFIVQTMGADQRTVRELMKVKALAHRWTKTFIKGDTSTSLKEFDGLQTRLAGNQVVAAGSTSGGDALSLAKLDEMIDAVDDNLGAKFLLMNKTMRRRLSAAARLSTVGGYITYDLDGFGRRVTRYNDLPILIVDKDETNTAILPFTEANPGGGSAASTSIYCVALGEGAVSGIQNGTIDVRDLGEQDSKPVFRTRVEWYTSFVVLHSRAAARLKGIKDAAVTA